MEEPPPVQPRTGFSTFVDPGDGSIRRGGFFHSGFLEGTFASFVPAPLGHCTGSLLVRKSLSGPRDGSRLYRRTPARSAARSLRASPATGTETETPPPRPATLPSRRHQSPHPTRSRAWSLERGERGSKSRGRGGFGPRASAFVSLTSGRAPASIGAAPGLLRVLRRRQRGREAQEPKGAGRAGGARGRPVLAASVADGSEEPVEVPADVPRPVRVVSHSPATLPARPPPPRIERKRGPPWARGGGRGGGRGPRPPRPEGSACFEPPLPMAGGEGPKRRPSEPRLRATGVGGRGTDPGAGRTESRGVRVWGPARLERPRGLTHRTPFPESRTEGKGADLNWTLRLAAVRVQSDVTLGARTNTQPPRLRRPRQRLVSTPLTVTLLPLRSLRLPGLDHHLYCPDWDETFSRTLF